MAALAVGSAVVSAALVPGGAFGLVEGNYRWLWPIAGFSPTAIIASLGSLVPSRSADRPRRRSAPFVATMAAISIVGLSAGNVATSYQIDLLHTEVPQRAVAQNLLGQLDAADLRSPVLIDRSEAEFGNPHAFPVLLRLQQDGVAFTFDNDPDVARFGTGRADGGRARQQLSLVTGGPASEPHRGPPGSRSRHRPPGLRRQPSSRRRTGPQHSS